MLDIISNSIIANWPNRSSEQCYTPWTTKTSRDCISRLLSLPVAWARMSHIYLFSPCGVFCSLFQLNRRRALRGRASSVISPPTLRQGGLVYILAGNNGYLHSELKNSFYSIFVFTNYSHLLLKNGGFAIHLVIFLLFQYSTISAEYYISISTPIILNSYF